MQSPETQIEGTSFPTKVISVSLILSFLSISASGFARYVLQGVGPQTDDLYMTSLWVSLGSGIAALFEMGMAGFGFGGNVKEKCLAATGVILSVIAILNLLHTFGDL